MDISSQFSNRCRKRGRPSLILVLGVLAAVALLVASPASAQTPTTLTLTPPTATNPLGAEHTVTATVLDEAGQPLPSAAVFFTVMRQDEQFDAICVTEANGECSITYQGPLVPAVDAISAFARPTATARWIPASRSRRRRRSGRTSLPRPRW
jgi:hypothetical protein